MMRLFLYCLFLFVLSHAAYPQTILYDKEEIELDSFTQQQLLDLNDSLFGEWRFVRVESYFMDDTCDLHLFSALFSEWSCSLSLVFLEPYTCLLKYNLHTSSQISFANCAYSVEIMPFDGLAFFFLKFELNDHITAFGNPIVWNGCLTDFTSASFTLTTEKGCSWVFEKNR